MLDAILSRQHGVQRATEYATKDERRAIAARAREIAATYNTAHQQDAAGRSHCRDEEATCNGFLEQKPCRDDDQGWFSRPKQVATLAVVLVNPSILNVYDGAASQQSEQG